MLGARKQRMLSNYVSTAKIISMYFIPITVVMKQLVEEYRQAQHSVGDSLLRNLAKVQPGQICLAVKGRLSVHCYLTKIFVSELPHPNKKHLCFSKTPLLSKTPAFQKHLLSKTPAFKHSGSHRFFVLVHAWCFLNTVFSLVYLGY